DGDGSHQDDDGDDLPELTIDDETTDENCASSIDVALTISLSRKTEKDASVRVSTQELSPSDDENADWEPASSDDFDLLDETVTIPPDQQSVTIHVQVSPSVVADRKKKLSVVLSEPENAILGDPSTAEVTI